jgi:hypothetical protein
MKRLQCEICLAWIAAHNAIHCEECGKTVCERCADDRLGLCENCAGVDADMEDDA